MAFQLMKIDAARVSLSVCKVGNNILIGNGSHDSVETTKLIKKNLHLFMANRVPLEISNPMLRRFIGNSLAFNRFKSLPFIEKVSPPHRVPSLSYYSTPLSQSPPPPPSNSNCSGPSDDKNNKSSSDDKLKLPTPQKLQHVHDILLDNLPRLFTQSQDYKIYHKDVVFENRIRDTITFGLSMYAMQIAVLKMLGHIKFSYIKFHIMSITKCEKEGTIKIRWRIRGVTTIQALIHYYKSKRWNLPTEKSKGGEMSNWYDGYSTFYVNSEGLVTRHVVDNVFRDEGLDEKVTINLAKLAIAVGCVIEGHNVAPVPV